MKLEIKQITSRKPYEAFLQRKNVLEHLTFYHSWEWGELMSERSLAFERLPIYDGKNIVAVGQFAKTKLKVGSYWYCPRGMVLDYSNNDLVEKSYSLLKNYFKSKKDAGFLRVDPNIIRGESAEKLFDGLGARKAYIFTQAERVWIIDLQKDEVSLLEWMKQHDMRSNVRRGIKKAKDNGVIIKASGKNEDVDILIKLLHEMSDRKGGVGLQADNNYKAQFKKMAPLGYEKIFIAEKDGVPIAAAMIMIYGNEASYLHAASSNEHRNLMAPHLLIFEAMKHIQQNYPNVKYFNFWGIVSDKNRKKSHPRHGYSEFKRGFGGYKLEYMRSRDFVYNELVWRSSQAIDAYRVHKTKND